MVIEEDYLSVADAAERVNMEETTLRRYVREGKLPALRTGETDILIRPADLGKLLTLLQGDEAMDGE